MSKNEVINTINEIKTAIAKQKKTLKQLTDIAATLEQIAPALPHESIYQAIDEAKFSLELYADNLKSYKKKLRLLEQLEAIVIK